MGAGRNGIVAERRNALVSVDGLLMRGFGVFQRPPRLLGTGEVFLLSAMLLGAAMCVRGGVMQFRRALVILVMGAVVIACGHGLEGHNLPRLVMGFLGDFVSVLGVFQRPLGMPVSGRVIPFFVVLGSRAMGVRRPLVFLGRPPV